MQLSVAHDFLPKTPTVRTSRVRDDFGISFEQGRYVIAEDLELPIAPGQIVAFTGVSGSGKSSLMQAAAEQLNLSSRVLNIDSLDLGNRPLVDTLPGSVDDAVRLLSQCGLGEAHLMLRTPTELSEGQRYRFRLALAIAQQPDWIIADEFSATLDRTLAKVVAFGLRRHLRDRRSSSSDTNAAEKPTGESATARPSLGFLIATTHEDILDDLAPDTHVRCDLDGRPTVHSYDRKKKDAHVPSQTTSGSVTPPVATGRTLLAGTIAPTTSG